MKIVFVIIIFFHGLVHLLYIGQNKRYFKTQPDLAWPLDSWILSNLFNSNTISLIASISMGLLSLIFIISGFGLFIWQYWWRPSLLCAGIFSSIFYFLLWDGKFKRLHDQGIFGIVVNILLIVFLFIY